MYILLHCKESIKLHTYLLAREVIFILAHGTLTIMILEAVICVDARFNIPQCQSESDTVN